MMENVHFAVEVSSANCEDCLAGGCIGAKRFRFKGY